MVLKLVASSFLLILTAVSSAPAVPVAPVVPLQVKPVAYYGGCSAICPHPSHGNYGWLGPARTGSDAKDQAWKDAKEHNEEQNKNLKDGELKHQASPNC
jgi:hypothetical protein